MEGNDFIATVDVNADTMTLVDGSWFEEGTKVPDNVKTMPCQVMVEAMANAYLDTEEEKEAFRRHFDRKRILEVMEKEGETILSSKYVTEEGKTRYRQYRCTWLDKDKGAGTLCRNRCNGERRVGKGQTG